MGKIVKGVIGKLAYNLEYCEFEGLNDRWGESYVVFSIENEEGTSINLSFDFYGLDLTNIDVDYDYESTKELGCGNYINSIKINVKPVVSCEEVDDVKETLKISEKEYELLVKTLSEKATIALEDKIYEKSLDDQDLVNELTGADETYDDWF